jgi:hypothetical protein
MGRDLRWRVDTPAGVKDVDYQIPFHLTGQIHKLTVQFESSELEYGTNQRAGEGGIKIEIVLSIVETHATITNCH